jgi:hypothetical protein
MSETVSTRQDSRIQEHLDSSFDKELFDSGSFAGLRYDPIVERRGSFADEVATRLEVLTDRSPDEKALTHNPAFLLGLVSAISERREHLAELAQEGVIPA